MADNVLRDKAFNLAKIIQNMTRRLALMVYKLFNKNNSGRAVKTEIISSQYLA